MQVLRDLRFVDWKMATDVENDLGAFLSFWLLDAKDKCALVFRNVDRWLLIYKAYGPCRLESAETPLWEAQI